MPLMISNRDLHDVLSLYFVMGSPDAGSHAPLETIRIALQAGITCFQWREKGEQALTGNERVDFAYAARQLCRDYHVPFFVDDDPALALLLKADGIHVGQKGEQARRVRQKIGNTMWLGVSAHSTEEAEKALRDGADYIGVGPYKPTQSKNDAEAPIGDSVIRKLSDEKYPLPMVAIGGVTPDDVPDICSAGASGVAVISAISKAKDPAAAVNCFLTKLCKG